MDVSTATEPTRIELVLVASGQVPARLVIGLVTSSAGKMMTGVGSRPMVSTATH
jgi:hypothetical protein